MGDDAVRVVTEDVLASGLKAGGSVETGGEVGGKEGPNREGSEEGGPV